MAKGKNRTIERGEISMTEQTCKKTYELQYEMGNIIFYVLVTDVNVSSDGILKATKIAYLDKYDLGTERKYIKCDRAEIILRGDFYLEEYKAK